ncbi:MAG TPA: sigma-70 family RNA polymerase sigma factor [Acidimicrobiia bacterium]|jgi:RNA polymerase sigma-70 factor (ECF subfamily)
MRAADDGFFDDGRGREGTQQRAVDPVDLRAVVVEHNAQIFRFARSLTQSDADAEDLAQTALVRALQQGPLHCSADQAKWYVLQIVRNLAIDQARARARIAIEPYAVVPERASVEPLPDELVVGADDRLPLRLLEKLAPHHRDVLRLRFLEELDYDVLAERLQVTEQAARQRVYRALQVLRRTALRLHAT